MNNATIFAQLLESGVLVQDEPSTYDAYQALGDVLDFANERGKLRTEGAWRLAGFEARKMEARYGYRPPSGWESLVGLAAGCGYFRANREAFSPQAFRHEVSEPDTVRRKLIEAMTCNLVPPATAASIFIVLGVHPAWGLYLAKTVQEENRRNSRKLEDDDLLLDTSLFPKNSMMAVRRGVFGILSLVVTHLRELEPRIKYPIDSFAEAFSAIVRYIRASTAAQAGRTPPKGLPAFLQSSDGNHRLALSATRDLFQHVFVPAGAARLLADAYFSVTPSFFERVKVDGLNRQAQDCLLGDFLAAGSEDNSDFTPG